MLIDIRTSYEYQKGHIKNSVSITPEHILRNTNTIAPSKTTKLVIYDTDNSQSPEIAKQLLDDGYHNVSILEGGLQQWILEDHTLESIN
tara:strand:- start:12928 stop:13194 length:267 start_codon:yes stop_codon:yes gene_type:complete